MARTPTTLDDINARKKPRRSYHWIITDSDLEEEFERLAGDLEQAEMRYRVSPETEAFRDEVDRLSNELDELRETVRKPENSLRFVFQALGARNYDKLVNKHQMSDDRKEELRGKGKNPDAMPYDPETFSVAIVAASMIEPEGVNEDYVKDVLQGPTFASADFMALYSAALDCNTRHRNPDLGKGSRSTRGSRKN